MHDNEEVRARFLAGYFNKIVALFSGLLSNKPEAILEDRITAKGRIEYQFRTYSGVTIVFIEVKLDVGSLTERLNCYAQVIAECDGEFRNDISQNAWLTVFAACAWMNLQNGFNVPIPAILCDGTYFYFFKFEDRRQAGSAPQFFIGKFSKQLLAATHCCDEFRRFRRSQRSRRFLTPNSPSLRHPLFRVLKWVSIWSRGLLEP
jgi:hypothetical protein